MTREEIIQAISDDKMMPFIQPEQLAQIVAFVIENYQPSLPSNLDEAAEKSSQNQYSPVLNGSGNDICYPKRNVFKQGFKFGAKWMARQGETIECSVDWHDGPILNFSGEQLLSAITKAELKIGDKVIVQIKKKQ